MTPELERAWDDVEAAINKACGRIFMPFVRLVIRDDDVAEALRYYVRLEDIENGEQE